MTHRSHNLSGNQRWKDRKLVCGSEWQMQEQYRPEFFGTDSLQLTHQEDKIEILSKYEGAVRYARGDHLTYLLVVGPVSFPRSSPYMTVQAK
jgi:hypothetical protein